jgi:hypothetical protein
VKRPAASEKLLHSAGGARARVGTARQKARERRHESSSCNRCQLLGDPSAPDIWERRTALLPTPQKSGHADRHLGVFVALCQLGSNPFDKTIHLTTTILGMNQY